MNWIEKQNKILVVKCCSIQPSVNTTNNIRWCPWLNSKVAHICVSKLRHHCFIIARLAASHNLKQWWFLLLIGQFETNFSDIEVKIPQFLFIDLKTSSCQGLNVFTISYYIILYHIILLGTHYGNWIDTSIRTKDFIGYRFLNKHYVFLSAN